MKTIAIIPARFASTRLPGKPLALIAGKTMIQRVYEQVQKCTAISEVWVATDDDRIEAEVRKFNGNVVKTSSECPSGTDRCAEVLAKLHSDADVVINVQGDEPFIQPEQIGQLAELMKKSGAEIGTLCKKIEDVEAIFNPNVVKVVKSNQDKALYFSRNPVPFVRGEIEAEWINKTTFFKHVGMYGYRASILPELTQLPLGKLEQAENLEQLRWLEAGFSISVAETEWDSNGIDTPEDLKNAEAYFILQK